MSDEKGVMSICRDEDCPECEWPETYSEVDTNATPIRLLATGCRKCGWRVEQSKPVKVVGRP